MSIIQGTFLYLSILLEKEMGPWLSAFGTDTIYYI